MLEPVTTIVPVEWSYSEENLASVCKINGDRGLVSLKLSKVGTSFCDCLQVKAWAEKNLETPTVAEEFLISASLEFNDYKVEVVWTTDSHGPIVVKTADHD